ncbi:ganglioside-induced differentiation-associated protein 1 [Plakobranchus ocellatus]|uniref:Ganglioside-induced differentiation-associated protein 1 n=1 Tax=Plakobranchus ocellatus TaxID=259542 RepID=A0AAV4BJE7_9GAST|nr:ganglioside-induced differentiation-associated protein 1 [Plakobranchus ocellatus]
MTSESLRLLYWPTSSASQKAWLALEEKQLKFKTTVINLLEGEQNEPWYLRINPAGQVPVLQVGDRFVAESDVIIDTVDKLNSGVGPQLVPDASTPEGKLVQYWRQKFSEVSFYHITYGTIINRDTLGVKIDLPPSYMFTKEDLAKKFDKTIQYLESQKPSNPDLVDVLDKKIKAVKGLADFEALSAEKVEEAWKSLEKMFDEMETQLRKSRTENILEHWFCGPNFTACDIFLAMLFGRISFLGYASRILNSEKRPAVAEYWAQLCRRPTVQKVVLNGKKALIKYQVARKAKTVVLGTAAAAGVVALGLFLGIRYKS